MGRKITNSSRITKRGKTRMLELLNSPLVDRHHKNLLRGIESNLPKNVSPAQWNMFDTISRNYPGHD